MAEKNELKTYSDDSLAKSNILIQSKYKTTVLGNKLIALGLFHLQKGEFEMSASGGNIVCKIPAAEIRDRLGKKGNSLYRDLDATSKRLMNYQLGYKDPEKQEFRYINLFTEMGYVDGILTIIFNGDMKMYLSELKDNYTLLNLPLMLKWQRSYTFRLFEILSSRTYLYRDQGYHCEAEFGLAELKFTLGCYDVEDDKVRVYLKDKQNPDYEMAEKALGEKKATNKAAKTQILKWFDFKKNIIDPAVEEINSTAEADMIIDEVEPLKKGRGGKVYGVIFKYRVNLQNSENGQDCEENEGKEKEQQLTEDEKFDLEATVKREIFSQLKLPINDVRAICEEAKYDIEIIKRANELLNEQHSKIENVTGWIISCIRKDYSSSTKVAKEAKKRKNGFHNFEEREYTKAESSALEKRLLQRQTWGEVASAISGEDNNTEADIIDIFSDKDLEKIT